MDNHKEVSIDFCKIWTKLLSKRYVYVGVIIIVTLLSAVYIYSIPRKYSTDLKLAPELGNNKSNSGISNIASSLGIDIGEIQSQDAITPLLYPTLLEDNRFIFSLINLSVKADKNSMRMPYYVYILTAQKMPWWSLKNEKKSAKIDLLLYRYKNRKINPYMLSKEEEDVFESIRSNLSLKVDHKNGVITITAIDQSPYVCKLLCEHVRQKLQDFITKYRTNKARRDYLYYSRLTVDAKAKYEKARKIYGSYADANSDVMLESYISKRNDLENDMQLKYNSYTSLLAQQEAAQAKIQERTPAFTILKGAELPTKPFAPKRMMFVFIMNIVGLLGTTVFILGKDMLKLLNI